MSIFRVKLHYLLCYCNILYFAILSYNIRKLHTKNTSVNILFIFCHSWLSTLYQGHLSIRSTFSSTITCWNLLNIRCCLNTLLWLAYFPSKSVKVSRKIGWSSSIPSKSVQVLWRTLIKVFFDHLHHQSLHQKLWPSFLVQENTVNRALCFFFWRMFHKLDMLDSVPYEILVAHNQNKIYLWNTDAPGATMSKTVILKARLL